MKRRAVVSLFFIIVLIFPVNSAFSQDEIPAVNVSVDENSRQLRIFREALLQGSSEQIRVEAAVELLLRNEPGSREVLVTALKSTDNPQARQAVCKALIKSRGLGQAIGPRQPFLDPLMQILITAPSEQAMTAAEALLLFDYSEVAPGLNEILQNIQADRQSRINAVYALQIRPEPEALRSLIGLLDDPDIEVSKAAENALQEAFGIPVGTNRKVWSDILDELKQKSPDDIRRERLLRQEMKLRQVQAERDRWQKLYLSLLDRQYDSSDDAGRARLTLEMLNSDPVPIRLWALGKVTQYQAADKDALRDKLFALLSDESRDVRLQTARVLNNMSALNPAQKLLERFKVETDPDVALAMFESLGEACFFAFSPGSEIKLPATVKEETMTIAVQYLFRDQTETARKAAEVIRKLLELNNLNEDSVRYYLGVINERYQLTIDQNPVLRADLLSVMSNLCDQGLSKAQASKLYEDLFIAALDVADNAPLRLAGLKGIINIDPVKAYALSQQSKLMYDESPAIRLLVIQLAANSGGTDDLDWLLSMLKNNQAEQAWQAVKSILQRQKSTFLLQWIQDHEGEINRDEYPLEILELAEQKALGEKATGNLITAQKGIIQWYVGRRAFDRGVLYLEKIQYDPLHNPFDDTVNSEILWIYMLSGNDERVVQIIQNELTKENFAESSPFYQKIDRFFNDEAISDGSKRDLYQKLSSIPAEAYPGWADYIAEWRSVYGNSPETEPGAPLQNTEG